MLGEAWTVVDGQLTLKAVAEAGKVEAPAPEVTEPEVTAPETTEPVAPPTTGDSAFVFVLIAIISVLGIAVVSKRKEN